MGTLGASQRYLSNNPPRYYLRNKPLNALHEEILLQSARRRMPSSQDSQSQSDSKRGSSEVRPGHRNQAHRRSPYPTARERTTQKTLHGQKQQAAKKVNFRLEEGNVAASVPAHVGAGLLAAVSINLFALPGAWGPVFGTLALLMSIWLYCYTSCKVNEGQPPILGASLVGGLFIGYGVKNAIASSISGGDIGMITVGVFFLAFAGWIGCNWTDWCGNVVGRRVRV